MANIKLKCLLIKFQKVVTRVGLHGTPVGFKLNSVIQFCAFLKNYFIFPILPSPTNGRPPPQPQPPPPTAAPSDDTLAGSFLRKLHEHVPDSSQLLGYLTLFVSSGVLLLTGLTVTPSVTGMIFLTPLIILTSPLWVSVAALVALAAAGVVSVGGFGFAALAGLSWLYKYFGGLHPLGLERTDYARDRIYDTARHVKDYAREYGEYLQTKLKDVVPDA